MDSVQIGVDALRDLLESGRPVTVLDIRPAQQRKEWHIPGSRHFEGMAVLRKGGSPGGGLGLPADGTVVAVCAHGNSSLFAVEALRRQGIPALSLQGGMQAWSLAWNLADVEVPGSAAQIVQVRRTGKGCLSYIVASNGQAAVIDASVDADVYLRIAAERGWRITHAIDTHVHADHLSRSRVLAERCGATVCMPEQKRTSYEHHALRDGDSIRVGEIEIRAIHTPGHTLESTSYMVDERALITGDTLFPAAVGRPDLAANPEQAKQRAHALYATLQKLLALPAETLILAGHTSEPIAFDGAPVCATLAQARAAIAMLGAPEDGFVEILLGRIPATPPNHIQIVQLNEAGQFPGGDPTELEAGANRCAIA